MTFAPPFISEELCHAFRTALLLTRNTMQAEAAVLEAVLSVTPLEPASGLSLRTCAAALTAKLPAVAATGEDPSLAMLPQALRRVAALPAELRGCFVLRMLAGLSREQSALLLGLDPVVVDANVGAAAQVLCAKYPVGGRARETQVVGRTMYRAPESFTLSNGVETGQGVNLWARS